MEDNFKLPHTISEIHFGFLSGKHYIGTIDVGRCTEMNINFSAKKGWTIKATYKDSDGNISTDKKCYENRIDKFGIQAICSENKSSAAEKTTDNK